MNLEIVLYSSYFSLTQNLHLQSEDKVQREILKTKLPEKTLINKAENKTEFW